MYEIGNSVTHVDVDDLLISDGESNSYIVKDIVLPQAFKKLNLCIDGCKFQSGKKSIKKEDTVQCHQHWSHPSCVGENHKDIIGKWSCPTCHTMPDVLGTSFWEQAFKKLKLCIDGCKFQSGKKIH